MALRNPATINQGTGGSAGTFTYAGVLCLAPAGRTCIAHGLPETPDVVLFSPIAYAANASLHPYAAGLESWNAVSAVFVNSINFGLAVSVELRVAWAPTA